ncbi:MAG: hypothetical protein V7609_3005 [Verrucomicrobiota bacterium]
MQKKYLIAGLASGLLPVGLMYGQEPVGPHFDGEIPTSRDTVIVVGTGRDANGNLDPYIELGYAPWTGVSGWVYTDDYYNVNGEGYLWNNGTYPYGYSPWNYPQSLDIWDYYGWDLGADSWFWYDDCRSYTDWCN